MTSHIKLKGDPKCFRCGASLDGCSNIIDDKLPETGDVSVCTYCSAVMQFSIANDGAVTMKEATAEVMLELSKVQPLISELQKILQNKKAHNE